MTVTRGTGELRRVTAWGMVPTPFTRDGAVDRPSLCRVVQHLRRCGCDGVIALGAIAEPFTLSPRERSDVVRTIATAADGAPVVGAVLSLDSDRFAVDFDALEPSALGVLDAVMIPVTTPDPNSLRSAIARAGDVSGLPVFLQDLPRFSGVHVGHADLIEAVSASPSCIAVKCEAPPTYERIGLLAAHTEATLISGFGGLGVVDDVIAGASSVAIGSTVTRAVVDATRLALAGRYDDASTVIGTVAARIHFETQPGANVAIRKRHWERAGVIDTHVVRAPTLPYHSEFEKHSAVHAPGVPQPGLSL
ncbi:dihydrodipicolinate synthase family protein [Rhodococcus sp. NPDC057529]|uniref:dihydrodipicolinate synthase family protein n=1 Tax=Rhodococcus sp. NPDC057529 TaxID=3346158 RepID=UPI00366FD4AE